MERALCTGARHWQTSFLRVHRLQLGRSSEHLTRLNRHVMQPSRDFACEALDLFLTSLLEGAMATLQSPPSMLISSCEHYRSRPDSKIESR